MTGGLKYALQLRNFRAYILFGNYEREETVAKSTIFDLKLQVTSRVSSSVMKQKMELHCKESYATSCTSIKPLPLEPGIGQEKLRHSVSLSSSSALSVIVAVSSWNIQHPSNEQISLHTWKDGSCKYIR
jgi:hypothetical protein